MAPKAWAIRYDDIHVPRIFAKSPRLIGTLESIVLGAVLGIRERPFNPEVGWSAQSDYGRRFRYVAGF